MSIAGLDEPTGTPDGTEEPHTRSLFSQRTHEELHLIANIKRFVECFESSASLRQALQDEAEGERAVQALRLPLSSKQLRPVWDKSASSDDRAEIAVWFRWLEDLKGISRVSASQADTGGLSPAFDAWHRRQIARTESEFGRGYGLALQPVVAFELSRGCSVGCWFCGVSSDKFQGYLPYTEENAVFWRDCLHALKQVLGRGMLSGFCYWATEPLDNPDYIHFITDYHAITGWLPPMTTAVPMRNIRRTREVLQLADQNGRLRNRFSVLTPATLAQIHAEFSPMELLRVDLEMKMKGSLVPLTLSGRALEREARKTPYEAFPLSGTIACVSGFLINMLDRVVRLITPCTSTPANPRGYHILAESSFNSGAELAEAVSKMIACHMPERVSQAGRLRFRPDLRFEPYEQGFRLAGRAVTHTIKGAEHVRHLGEMILEGTHTAAHINATLIACGGDVLALRGILKRLFDQGMFDITTSTV